MIDNIKKQFKNLSLFVESSTPVFVLFLEIVLGIIITLSSLFLLVKIRSEILEKEFLNFDMSILQALYIHRTPFLTRIMLFITNFGSNYMIIMWLGLIVFLAIKKHFRETTLLGFMLSMATVINMLIKQLIHRPRPYFHPLIVEKDYSFPSGHAMNSFVFYVTLAYLTYHFTHSKKATIIASILAFVIIFLIGLSRVYLGVHYPTDVLAGYVAGLCWFVSVLLIQKTLVFYKLFKDAKKS